MNEFDLTSFDTPLPQFPHPGSCNCPECDAVYYQRKEIRQRDIKAAEAQIARNSAEPFSPMVISILIAIVGMLSFLAGVMLDKKLGIF